MPLVDEFTNDPEDFLSRYAVSVRAAETSSVVDANGNTIWNAGLGRFLQLSDITGNHFGGTANYGRSASLNAYQATAFFRLSSAAAETNMIGCSVGQVEISFSQAAQVNGQNGVPIYIIPYQGTKSLGVKLPAGLGDAYAMTATQNGCTVEISGTRQRPYASHSNSANLGVVNNDFAARGLLMRDHLDNLHQAYTQAEQNAHGNVARHTQNRAQFNFFTPSNQFQGANVNYQDITRLIGLAQNARRNIKGRRVNSKVGHVRYYLTLARATIDAMNNRQMPPQAIVMGKRSNGVWTFYYQTWRPLSIEVRKSHKLWGLKVRTENLGAKHITGIMAHGQLWPGQPTCNAITLH